IGDVVFEHADGRVKRARKVSPAQTKRAAEEYERQLRAALLSPIVQKKEIRTLQAFADRCSRMTPGRPTARAPSRETRAAEQARRPALRPPAAGRDRHRKYCGLLRPVSPEEARTETIRNIGATLHRRRAA